MPALILTTQVHIRTDYHINPPIMNCSKLVNNTDLRLLNINFRSIMNKRAEFIHLIDSLKPDIIVGTETWLSNSIKNSEIIPDNMNFTVY